MDWFKDEVGKDKESFWHNEATCCNSQISKSISEETNRSKGYYGAKTIRKYQQIGLEGQNHIGILDMESICTDQQITTPAPIPRLIRSHFPRDPTPIIKWIVSYS